MYFRQAMSVKGKDEVECTYHRDRISSPPNNEVRESNTYSFDEEHQRIEIGIANEL